MQYVVIGVPFGQQPNSPRTIESFPMTHDEAVVYRKRMNEDNPMWVFLMKKKEN